MKKLILLSAIALLGFASCKKEDPQPVKKEIKGPEPAPDRQPKDTGIVFVPGGLR